MLATEEGAPEREHVVSRHCVEAGRRRVKAERRGAGSQGGFALPAGCFSQTLFTQENTERPGTDGAGVNQTGPALSELLFRLPESARELTWG